MVKLIYSMNKMSHLFWLNIMKFIALELYEEQYIASNCQIVQIFF